MSRQSKPKRKRAEFEKAKKRTSPTTVRLRAHLDVWVDEMVEQNAYPHGQSGLINDALEHYKQLLDQKKKMISGAIGGGSP